MAQEGVLEQITTTHFKSCFLLLLRLLLFVHLLLLLLTIIILVILIVERILSRVLHNDENIFYFNTELMLSLTELKSWSSTLLSFGHT